MTTQNANEIRYSYSLRVTDNGTYLESFCNDEFEGESYLGTNCYGLIHTDNGTYLEEGTEDGGFLRLDFIG